MAESNLMDKTHTLLDQLGKAFLELEALNYAAEDKVCWKEIEEHFRQLETEMVKKYSELQDREKAFKEEESEFLSFLEVKEADVAAKEQDMIDRLQELKDAAVASIREVRGSHPSAALEAIDVGDNKESKVSNPHGDKNAILTAQEETPLKIDDNGVAGEVKPNPQLTQFCEQMDSKGLLNYIIENHKNIPSIRDELSVALESATEPGRLVLASLEGLHPLVSNTQEGDKNHAVLLDMLKSCLILLEALATLLAKADPSADHFLSPEIKQQAKAIADKWKPMMADGGIGAANGSSLEAEAFFQILATFRIGSAFDEDELCKIVLAVVQKRQMPELYHSLDLAHKMQGVVESLINSGRQIDAVHVAHAFGLTEHFPLVPLLKTYLKDLRRNSQGKGGSSGNAGGAQNDANAQELAALKAVIRCVQGYKLQADYPLDPLQRRVAQLENTRSDKKRPGESGKQQQTKKPRANGGFHGYRPPVAAAFVAGRQGQPVFVERAYAGKPERYPHVVPNNYNYQAPMQSTYAQAPTQSTYAQAPTQSTYAQAPTQSTYAQAPTQSTYPVYDERTYYYPHDEQVAPPPAYSSAPPSYDGYMGSGMPPPHQSYM